MGQGFPITEGLAIQMQDESKKLIRPLNPL